MINSDMVERLARFTLSVIIQAYMSRDRRQGRPTDRRTERTLQGDPSEAVISQGRTSTSELTGQLLREILECVGRLYRRSRRLGDDGNPRRRHSAQSLRHQEHRQRDSFASPFGEQEVRESLESVSRELQTVYDSIQRAVYGPTPHPDCSLHDSLVADANQLQIAITLCLRRINETYTR